MDQETILRSLESVNALLDHLGRQAVNPDARQLENTSEQLHLAADQLKAVLSAAAVSAGDATLRAAMGEFGERCSRLQTVFAAGEQYCSHRIRILSVPRDGYTDTGVAAQLELAGELAIEG